MEEKYYTPDEVAGIFQISKHTVYELIKRGDLHAFKIGNKMRIDCAEIERYKKTMTAPVRSVNRHETSNLSSSLKLAGSHDFLLENFLKYALSHDLAIHPAYIGSLEGLMLLYRGQADIAAVHLLDPSSHEYNIPFIKQLFVHENITVMRFSSREQGFITAKDNPKKINQFSDLTRSDVNFVNRQKGSGTRYLFDSLLSCHHIQPAHIKGYSIEEWNHLASASYISRGSSDVTFGIRSAATRLGLEFIPVTKEQFDLVFRWTDENREDLQKVFNLLHSQQLITSLRDLEGYDISRLGEIIYQNGKLETSHA